MEFYSCLEDTKKSILGWNFNPSIFWLAWANLPYALRNSSRDELCPGTEMYLWWYPFKNILNLCLIQTNTMQRKIYELYGYRQKISLFELVPSEYLSSSEYWSRQCTCFIWTLRVNSLCLVSPNWSCALKFLLQDLLPKFDYLVDTWQNRIKYVCFARFGTICTILKSRKTPTETCYCLQSCRLKKK